MSKKGERLNEAAEQLGIAYRLSETVPFNDFTEMVSLILAELAKRATENRDP
jgi:hypothetical protein